VCADPLTSEHASPKLRALLKLALEVRESGRSATDQTIAEARALGATDVEIHDTVLIAAAFCMFNRYVDGLGASDPDTAVYREMGKQLAERGYKAPSSSGPSAPDA
jgi:hypothetical protein